MEQPINMTHDFSSEPIWIYGNFDNFTLKSSALLRGTTVIGCTQVVNLMCPYFTKTIFHDGWGFACTVFPFLLLLQCGIESQCSIFTRY